MRNPPVAGVPTQRASDGEVVLCYDVIVDTALNQCSSTFAFHQGETDWRIDEWKALKYQTKVKVYRSYWTYKHCDNFCHLFIINGLTNTYSHTNMIYLYSCHHSTCVMLFWHNYHIGIVLNGNFSIMKDGLRNAVGRYCLDKMSLPRTMAHMP